MFFFKLLIFFNLASNLFFMLETCQKIPSFYITHGGFHQDFFIYQNIYNCKINKN